MPNRLAATVFALAFAGVWSLPAATAEPTQVSLAPGAPLMLGGTPRTSGEEIQMEACRLTAIGYDDEQRLVGITAGHCARIGRVVYSELVGRLGQLGQVVRVHHDMGIPAEMDMSRPWHEDIDFAIIEFDQAKVVPSAAARVGGNDVKVADVGGAPKVGDKACQSGRTTSNVCGTVTEVQDWQHRAEFCTSEGDSGAPVFVGDRIVGLVTTALKTKENACGTELGSNLDAVLEAIGPGVGEGFQPFVG
ncbi:hypothetical protein [Segniliparus rugosus]|uniref:Peptidase S1 domain-containing protein n=1 Tax=Segniliparus rugosus (strain ATCC BAA-974 / DSM 45345 / CCUG 50838 / CIP 108380 / JCM 13579 / CDC 945) TaxID=679197 RepID=E5XLD4_SEGRC|nr:hypothetical protein [Segniliparus rugosus]EFV14853.1 hypothetical protein HMPREF9336_00303 [Segniliparus rugosus ATCC BAA-974]